MARTRRSASAALLVLVLAACDDSARADGDDEVASSGTDDAADAEPDPCGEVCLDTPDHANQSLCYACRCKAAFDDWLPAREELQCSAGEPIVAYQVDLSTPDGALEPAPIAATSCANPSIFTGSCMQGSRLGQLDHGDVTVRWICRDPYLDADGTVIYSDVGVIGNNVRTGVTCFWDDVNDVTHGDDLPPLDLMEATAEERARFEQTFYYTEGDGCTPCHDHDPFIYTPYLQSIPWKSMAAGKGPYALATRDGSVRATGNDHLVSPRAAPCTTCHRLGSEKTCTTLAPDALGAAKIASYEQAILDAADPGSPHWRLAYWMPSAAPAVPDFATWLELFADARDHILTCCEAPGQDLGDCRWEPVPAQ